MFYHSQINSIYKKGKKDVAVLLIHGFTGTPDIMRSLANHLHEQDYTVLAPLLAGHGMTRESLAASNWQDWYGTCVAAFEDLKKDHQKIFVAGLSLGGILTLKLTQDYPSAFRAAACLSTPLFLEKWVNYALPVIMNTPLRYLYRYQKKMALDVKDSSVINNIWNITEMPIASIYSLTKLQSVVFKNLAKTVSPTLLIHARNDSTAPYENMNAIAGGISSAVTETVTLENSHHLITVDFEKDVVNRKVAEFFGRFAT